MKCQILFPGKNKKNIFKVVSAENFTQHAEFVRWTFPSLKLGMSIVGNRGVSQKS